MNAPRKQTLLEKAAEQLRADGWDAFRGVRWIIDALLISSDIKKVRRLYYLVFGSRLRLLKPKTFNEKMQHLKIFDRKPEYTVFADKLAVREFVQERVGPDILTKLFWSGVDIDDVPKQRLPKRFVLKANHLCNANLVVPDASQFDWEQAKAAAHRWLTQDWSTKTAEWQYRWIPRRLLIEEYLEGAGGEVPMDYKFFCFHGRVEMIQVDVDRFSNHTRTLFDRYFNELPIGFVYPRYQGPLTVPECFEQMRSIAERLSAGEAFVRVDLYDVGHPVFGELTLRPEAGLGTFEPSEWDERLGNLL